MRPRTLRFLGPLLGLLVFGAALLVLRGELRGEHFRDVLERARALPRARLGLAVLLTAASYLALTGYDVLGLRYVGHPLRYSRIAVTSFISFAFSHVLGFPPLTGGSIRLRLYTAWGLSSTRVLHVIASGTLTFWLGVLTVGGGALLGEPRLVARVVGIDPAVARALGALALGLVGAYLVWVARGRRWYQLRGWRLRVPTLGLALAQVALGALDWMLAAGVLYVLLPSGSGLSYPAFLSAYVAACVAGAASGVPGGLGVFETVLLLLLPPTIPRTEILGSLLVYRAIYHLLPLIIATALLGLHEALQGRKVPVAARLFGRWVPALVPNVLAFTTFVGGSILLFSGATPSTTGRRRWLTHFLPLPVVELSHFLASLVGIGLVILAAGLQRRLDAAYHLAVLLLCAGIAFSLLKGFDYEEALALTIMLGALLPSRRHFYRHASLLSDPLRPAWVAAVGVVVISSIWLGLFSYQNVDLTRDLWWRVAWAGDAPRFLRATLGVMAGLLTFAIAWLLRPAPPDPAPPTLAELAEAGRIAAAAPDTLPFLALLGDKSILFNESRTAFLMYAVEGRSWVCLGDPVGPPEERAELAWRFREMVERQGGWPVFYLVSREAVPLYIDLGLSLFKLGEEARVPLASFSLDGKERKGMRRVVNALEKEGVTFEVLPACAVPALMPTLRRISDAWLAEKQTREKGFSLGAFRPDYLRRTPLAVLRWKGEIVAFANVLAGGRREELSVELMRFLPGSPPNVMEYLLIQLLLWGQESGHRWFNLGMAPLSGLENRSHAPLWNRVGALVFQLGEHFYNFRGLRKYKEKFDPVWQPRYIASPGGLALPRVVTNITTLISGGLKGTVTR